jgi:hypothetical protein
MNNLHFLADDRAELLAGGTNRCRPSSGGSTTTTTTNFTFCLAQSNCATNVVLGGFCSTGVIESGQSNCAVQGLGAAQG